MFGLFGRKNNQNSNEYGDFYDDDGLMPTMAAQYMWKMPDNLELLRNTTNAETFFYRYGYALECLERAAGYEGECRVEGMDASELDDYLRDNRVSITNAFIDRCFRAKKGYQLADIKYQSQMPPESLEYYNSKAKEGKTGLAEEKTDYIYYSVVFNPYGKSWYYISTDDSYDVGDYVIVPAGQNNTEKVVQVVLKERFAKGMAPMSPSRVKPIIRMATKSESRDWGVRYDR